VDPFTILGVAPGAAEREVNAAYRELAKRWHPDRGGGDEAQRRMADINAAYDLLRAAARQGWAAAAARSTTGGGRGDWLGEPLRRALGPELLDALERDEPVRLVCPASTWASPRAILAVTERRLLWLLDDAPVARVRSLLFRDVETIGHRLRGPRRRVATLTVRSLGGRRHSFSGLAPHTAATIERHVSARARSAGQRQESRSPAD
jgi:curved DNA-binding protein CbpA